MNKNYFQNEANTDLFNLFYKVYSTLCVNYIDSMSQLIYDIFLCIFIQSFAKFTTEIALSIFTHTKNKRQL